MKFIFLSIIVLASFSTGFVACSSGAYNANPDSTSNAANPIYQPPASNVHFTATTGSSTFTATTAYYEDTTVSNISIFEIAGEINPTDPNNLQLISIVLTNYTGKGTYYMNDTSTAATFTYAPKGAFSSQIADSGVLVITSVSNNKLTGTFHFVTDSGINVTNGKFTNLPKL